MASFNRTTLLGNLTRDPETSYAPSGTAICKFGLAVNNKYKQGTEMKEDCLFIDITVFGKAGENCAKYLSKGAGVLIDGRLNFSSWEKDGQRRSKLDVVASTVQFLGKSGEAKAPQKKPAEKPPESNQGIEEDVPF